MKIDNLLFVRTFKNFSLCSQLFKQNNFVSVQQKIVNVMIGERGRSVVNGLWSIRFFAVSHAHMHGHTYTHTQTYMGYTHAQIDIPKLTTIRKMSGTECLGRERVYHPEWWNLRSDDEIFGEKKSLWPN